MKILYKEINDEKKNNEMLMKLCYKKRKIPNKDDYDDDVGDNAI